MQQLDTSVIAASNCVGIDGSKELCTDNPNDNSGACYGDSGGPQIKKVNGTWELIGATSRAGNNSSTCATGPSIYTNVIAYKQWIKEQTGVGGDPTDPVARFTSDCPTGGLACSFDGSGSTDSDGSITGYVWDFGDNSTGEGAKLSHTYPQKGTYTVKLTVKDNAGRTNTTTAQVTVGGSGGGTPPTASFTGNCAWQSPCSFDASRSTDPDGTITGYAWTFGDGTTGTGRTTTHTYPNANANYTAKLTVTDNTGNSASATKQINCYQTSFGTTPFCFIQ